MFCTGCRAASRPAKGTPIAGYCEGCGWALRMKVESTPRPLPGSEPIQRVTYSPDLVTVNPGAALLVARGAVAEERGHPPGLTREDEAEAQRRAMAPVIESRRAAGGAS